MHPEIAPPIAKSVDRDSGTFGVQTYEYGDVEIASEVGWDVYKQVADGIMRYITPQVFFMDTHTTGGQTWLSWMSHLSKSGWTAPQTSLYYSLQVMGDVQDKSDAYAALKDVDVDDYLSEILNEPQCDCQE